MAVKELNKQFAGQVTFDADIAINDTSLLIRDFTGNIDSSGFMFKGRLNNYPLWFSKVKKGRTQLAFDLKSNRLAMEDLLGSQGRMYVPQGYWKEATTGLWLRAKMDLRYDIHRSIGCTVAQYAYGLSFTGVYENGDTSGLPVALRQETGRSGSG